MNYFVKANIKENTGLSREKLSELSVEHIKLMLRYKAEGKIVYGGVLSGRRSAVYIVEVPTNDDLENFLFSWPLYSYCTFEIAPLSTLEFRLESLTKVLK